MYITSRQLTQLLNESATILIGNDTQVSSVTKIRDGSSVDFSNIIYSKIMPAPSSEVQNIRLSWTNDYKAGFFFVSFVDHFYNIRINFDDSDEDVELKLRSLPTVELVKVTRKDTNASIDWTVTFIGNLGDVELFKINGIETFDTNNMSKYLSGYD
jgi:hypothetical protein